MLMNLVLIFSIYIISYIFGYPLKVFLLNEKWKKYDLYITPWLGMASMMIILFYISILGFSINEAFLPFTIASLVVIILTALKCKQTVYFKKFDLIFVAAILFIGTIFYTLPGYLNNQNIFPTLNGNNDFISYVRGASYFNHLSIKELPDYGNLTYMMLGPQSRLMTLNIAYFSLLLGGDVLKCTYFFSCVVYLLSILSFSVLFRELEIKLKYVIIFTGLIFLNCNYHWTVDFGFLGQTMSIGLFILIFILFVKYSVEFTVKNTLLLAVLIAALGMAYTDMIPVLVAPMFAYLIFNLKCKDKFFHLLKTCIAAAVAVALINFRIYINVFKAFFSLKDTIAGWEMPIALYPNSLGLYNNMITAVWGNGINQTSIFMITVSILILLFTCKMIFSERKNNISMGLLVYTIAYTLLYLYFIKFQDPYKTYKAFVEMNFIFIVSFLYAMYLLLRRGKKSNLIRLIPKVILGGMMALNIVSALGSFALRMIYSDGNKEGYYSYQSTSIRENHYEYKDLMNSLDVPNYYLNNCILWDQIYALSILEDKSIHTMIKEWGYGVPFSEDPLPIPSAGDIYMESSYLPDPIYYSGEVIQYNENYTVRNLDTEIPFCYSYSGLQYIVKLNHMLSAVDTGRKVLEGGSELGYYSKSNNQKDVFITMSNAGTEENYITILFNGEIVKRLVIPAMSTAAETIEAVSFKEGYENKFSIIMEKNSEEIYLSRLGFDNTFSTPLQKYTPTDILKKYISIDLINHLKQLVKAKPLKIENMMAKIELDHEIGIVDKDSLTISGTIRVTNNAETIKKVNSRVNPVLIGVHLMDGQGNMIERDFGRIGLGKKKWKKGETISVDYELAVEKEYLDNGYYFEFQMLQENVSWYPPEIEGNTAQLKLISEEEVPTAVNLSKDPKLNKFTWGVYGDEGDFCWLSPFAKVVLKRETGNTKELLLYFNMIDKPLEKIDSNKDLNMDIYINEQMVKSVLVEEAGDYKIPIESHYLPESGYYIVELITNGYYCPKENGDSDDNRQLVARLISID